MLLEMLFINLESSPFQSRFINYEVKLRKYHTKPEKKEKYR
jgi:hypothetical protein